MNESVTLPATLPPTHLPVTAQTSSKRSFRASATRTTFLTIFLLALSFGSLGIVTGSRALAAEKTETPVTKESAAKPKKDVESPATTKESKSADKTKAPATPAAAPSGAKNKMTTVIIETSLGNIEVELNDAKAPVTVENFKRYIAKKHFDGLIFHLVIKDFMIQGGGMNEKMEEKKNDAPIKNEAANGLKNDRGTIAMARTPIVDSATSQFFINTVDNDFLNHKSDKPQEYGYAVFGKVTSGMDVVDKIRAVPTGHSMGMADVPKTPVVIKTIRLK
jgi:cyclophilin family peptidyl-prolyl cis-trans isomerase